MRPVVVLNVLEEGLVDQVQVQGPVPVPVPVLVPDFGPRISLGCSVEETGKSTREIWAPSVAAKVVDPGW